MITTTDRRADRRGPASARLAALTQEVADAMNRPTSPMRPLDPPPEPLHPASLDQLRQLLRMHGMRRIAHALADLAALDANAAAAACPPDQATALASRKNSGIMESIAVTLYE